MFLPSWPLLVARCWVGRKTYHLFSFCIFSILEFRVKTGLLSPLTGSFTSVLSPYFPVMVACLILIHTITATYTGNSTGRVCMTLVSQRTGVEFQKKTCVLTLKSLNKPVK